MHGKDGAVPLNAVLGCAINQDGRSSSLTAPNGPSQQQVRLSTSLQQVIPTSNDVVLHPVSHSTRMLAFCCPGAAKAEAHPCCVQVIRLALQDASLGAGDVGCLELHGTGTPLGDPIEVGAAAAVYGAPSWECADASQSSRQALCLGAVKSTLGHTEPAAGATGVCKTLLRCGPPCIMAVPHTSDPAGWPMLSMPACPCWHPAPSTQ